MYITKVCSKHNIEFKQYNSLSKCPKCRQVKKRVTNKLKPKTKKQQANERKKLRKKCDILWSKLIKIRAGFKSEYSGTTEGLNSHHIYSKSNYATRWDLDNGCCLTSGEHTLSSKFSAHKTPVEFLEWIKKRRGQEWYEGLRIRARDHFDWDKLEEVYLYLKSEYDKLESSQQT